MNVNISELRQNLPEAIDRVLKTGEPLLVTRRGAPLVKIVPLSAADTESEATPLRGVAIDIPGDFDEPMKGLLEQ